MAPGPGAFIGTRVECEPVVCGTRGGGSVFWEGTRDHDVSQNVEALLGALQSGKVSGALLDVFVGEFEAMPPTALWQHPNVLITPHVSDHVSDWPAIFGRFFGDNLERYKNNQLLNNQVLPP